MIRVNRQGAVWIYAEQEAGQLSDVPLELLSKGRELADQLKVPLGTVLVGHGVGELCNKLVAYGADEVIHVEHPLLKDYQTTSYARVVCDMITKYEPQIVLYGATAIGRDLAPRIASEMKAGLTADCTDLQIGNHEEKGGPVHENLLLQIRPAFGGNIIATIINYDRWPQMATVREGVMRMPEPNTTRKGKIIKEKVSIAPEELLVTILEKHRQAKKVNLKAARIIVSGGAGVGSKDNFKQLWDLANILGAAVGGSRAAVDLGFIDRDHQVGQTGTTVRPALYIACGISGAVQHRAGMQEAAKIVAINSDPNAPIFGVAHYGIVGDMNVVIPKMIKALKERS
jgi:electron transfer flavoprotein alpha subunit